MSGHEQSETGRTVARSRTATARTATARTARSRRTRVALIRAVRRELSRTGSFTADTVAELAGCSAATFYSHFATKDDALTAAFESVLEDLAANSLRLFNTEIIQSIGLAETVAEMVDGQAAFFRNESLVFRAALARLPDHRPLRSAYRDAENASLARLEATISDSQQLGSMAAGPTAPMAEALLVLSQGINNPRVQRPDAVELRAQITRAIVLLLTDPGVTP